MAAPRGATAARNPQIQALSWFSLLLVAGVQLIRLYRIEDQLIATPNHRLEGFTGKQHFRHHRTAAAPVTAAVPRGPFQQEGDCQMWSRQTRTKPTGLVVTLVMTPDEDYYVKSIKKMVCNSIPSQLHHLLGPQRWDMLLMIAGEHYHSELSNEYIIECLNLTRNGDAQQEWINLDGSNMTTTAYRYNDQINVYLAHIHLILPLYVQEDPSILNKTIIPKVCNSPKSYIQATRWYSNELLHLAILQQYDWWIKLDIDLFFHRTIPFDMLHDLQQRHALFGVTAETRQWSGTCSIGITTAMQDFLANETEQTQYCSHGHNDLVGDRDLYYTNFIIGRTDFWTQASVRKLGRFLTNYRKGFFEYRWTDQIFFHHALGLFTGPNFSDYVTDYSELRCSVETNCWSAVFRVQLYGYKGFAMCVNDGYFRHNKNPDLTWNRTAFVKELWSSDTQVWNTTYRDDCDVIIKKRKQYVMTMSDEEKTFLEIPVPEANYLQYQPATNQSVSKLGPPRNWTVNNTITLM